MVAHMMPRILAHKMIHMLTKIMVVVVGMVVVMSVFAPMPTIKIL
jgi:hypothetical protein